VGRAPTIVGAWARCEHSREPGRIDDAVTAQYVVGVGRDALAEVTAE